VECNGAADGVKSIKNHQKWRFHVELVGSKWSPSGARVGAEWVLRGV